MFFNVTISGKDIFFFNFYNDHYKVKVYISNGSTSVKHLDPIAVFNYEQVYFGEYISEKELTPNMDNDANLTFNHAFLFKLSDNNYILISEKIYLFTTKNKIINFILEKNNFRIVTNKGELKNSSFKVIYEMGKVLLENLNNVPIKFFQNIKK